MVTHVSIHWSLWRLKEHLHQKRNNIGQSEIVENDAFYQMWEQVTLDNYAKLHNFRSSGLGTAQRPILRSIPSEQVTNYIEQHLDRAY